MPKGAKVMFVPGNLALVKCTPDATFCPNVGPPKTTYYYLFKYHPHATAESGPIPEMSGSDLNLKGTRQDFGTQGAENGQPIVLMDFTHGGAKKFQSVTRTLAERGRTKWQTAGSPSGQQDNYAQQFAIVLDREIKSAPTVSFKDNPNGIPGTNGAEITGIGSVQRGEGPRARPPDGRPAVQLPPAREDRDLGDARQGFAARRRRWPRSAASSPSRSSCSSSTASSASSR